MADIFLSYTGSNRDFARWIANWLRESGWSVFWDDELRAGQPFDTQIENELDQAGCVVVLWTRESVERRWPRSEAGRALQQGKLVQVRLERARLPLEFERIEYVDAADRDSDAWLVRLGREVSKHLGRTSAAVSKDRLETGLEYSDLLSASPSQLQSLISRLTLQAKGGVGRPLAWQKLGICQMLLGDFDSAMSHLENSLQEDPSSANTHYFRACVLLKGRRPRRMSLSEIRAVEAELSKAIRCKDAPKQAYQLAALIKYDYYQRNGLLATPAPDLLLSQCVSAQSIPCESQRIAVQMEAASDETIRYLLT